MHTFHLLFGADYEHWLYPYTVPDFPLKWAFARRFTPKLYSLKTAAFRSKECCCLLVKSLIWLHCTFHPHMYFPPIPNELFQLDHEITRNLYTMKFRECIELTSSWPSFNLFNASLLQYYTPRKYRLSNIPRGETHITSSISSLSSSSPIGRLPKG